MGLLIEYFAAPSDQAAAATIDGRPRQAGLPVLGDWSIEPTIQMANLEEQLTGRSYEQIVGDGDTIVADRDGGEVLVLRLSNSLVRALIDATPTRRMQVAQAWSGAEEFYRQVDPDMLDEFLAELQATAGRAHEAGEQLYCWVSV